MESVLPPEVARKLLHKDLANPVKRVHEGKKLTRSDCKEIAFVPGAPETVRMGTGVGE